MSSYILEWNTLKQDLIKLYTKLAILGMEYRNGKVYLADLKELDKFRVK